MARCLVVFSTLVVAITIVGNAVAGSRYLYFKVKSPVPRGQLAHVVVQGPIGICRITVSRAGVRMRLRTRTGVDPLAAVSTNDVADGRVAWEWRLPPDTPLGQWRVLVRCGPAAPLQGTMLVTG